MVSDNVLLILVVILVIVSLFGSYMVLTRVYVTPTPVSTTSGKVGVTILGPRQPCESCRPFTSGGTVGVTILR
jgi:hypothetical protein